MRPQEVPMSNKAAITVHGPLDEVRSRFGDPDWAREHDAEVSFRDAPGDRGTEIHVELRSTGIASKLKVSALPKVKNELRRFKQRVETGEVPRSDGAPEGERVARKLKQRPAQPPASPEREKAGAA
jgi:hypothetical protein